MPARLLRRAAAGLILRDLRTSFRRVLWVGDAPPSLPAGRPLVLVANHHYFHDSYLLWYLLTQHLGRRPVVWMERWERAPLFGPLGALPFPADAPRERVRTIRETARRMEAHPATVLFLYPEAEIGPPDAGLAPFRTDFDRLAKRLPASVLWWPVALRITWWGEQRPTALLTGEPPQDTPSDTLRSAIGTGISRLRAARPRDEDAGRAHRLLTGRAGTDERWDLTRLAPFFKRFT